jgi:hypothetical protein
LDAGTAKSATSRRALIQIPYSPEHMDVAINPSMFNLGLAAEV